MEEISASFSTFPPQMRFPSAPQPGLRPSSAERVPSAPSFPCSSSPPSAFCASGSSPSSHSRDSGPPPHPPRGSSVSSQQLQPVFPSTSPGGKCRSTTRGCHFSYEQRRRPFPSVPFRRGRSHACTGPVAAAATVTEAFSPADSSGRADSAAAARSRPSGAGAAVFSAAYVAGESSLFSCTAEATPLGKRQFSEHDDEDRGGGEEGSRRSDNASQRCCEEAAAIKRDCERRDCCSIPYPIEGLGGSLEQHTDEKAHVEEKEVSVVASRAVASSYSARQGATATAAAAPKRPRANAGEISVTSGCMSFSTSSNVGDSSTVLTNTLPSSITSSNTAPHPNSFTPPRSSSTVSSSGRNDSSRHPKDSNRSLGRGASSFRFPVRYGSSRNVHCGSTRLSDTVRSSTFDDDIIVGATVTAETAATATAAASAGPLSFYSARGGYSASSTSHPFSVRMTTHTAAAGDGAAAASSSSFPLTSYGARHYPGPSHVMYAREGRKVHRGGYTVHRPRRAAFAVKDAHAAARETAAPRDEIAGTAARGGEEGEARGGEGGERYAAGMEKAAAAGERSAAAAAGAGAEVAGGESAAQAEGGTEEGEEGRTEAAGAEEKGSKNEETSTDAIETSADEEWTLQEQQKLEEALIFYRRMKNRAEMWKLISRFVGSRTPQQCLRRFRFCRQAALDRVQETACARLTAAEAEETVAAEGGGSLPSVSEDKQASHSSAAAVATCSCAPAAESGISSLSAAGALPTAPPAAARAAAAAAPAATSTTSDARAAAQQRLLRAAAARAGAPQQATVRGIVVMLRSPKLEGISAAHFSALKLLVACGRCSQTADLKVTPPTDWTTLAVAGTSAECGTCRMQLRVRAVPKIFFAAVGAADCAAVSVEAVQCGVRDLLPSDYLLTCASCSAVTRAREVLSGSCRTAVCRNCHAKLTFSYQSAYLEGGDGCDSSSAAAAGGAAAAENSSAVAAKQQKKKQDFAFKVGTPLPDNGACKHYKKSFRWLRFPCCGKAFACDICHDEATDHEHVWATRMICGFCSKEQPYASCKPCQTCGHSVTKDGKSAHWEGGKGCRDATRMSRRDPKKYKLLHKQTRMVAGARSKS